MGSLTTDPWPSVVLLVTLALACETRERALPVVTATAERTASRETLEVLPYYDSADFEPRWLSGDRSELEGFHAIPDFELTNQDGMKVTAQTFQGKIYVADFFFSTCPVMCPKMTAAMAKLQEAFADATDVLFLSHSVTPDVDTPEVLRRFAKRYGVVSGKWHLVTGDRSLIYGLGRDHYFVEEDLGKRKTDDDFLHTDNFLLIDRDRHIRGIYSGLSRSDMRQLESDVALLRREGE